MSPSPWYEKSKLCNDFMGKWLKKHRSPFGKVVEGSVFYNFRIWSFWTSKRIFGVTPSQTGVDYPKTSLWRSGARSRAEPHAKRVARALSCRLDVCARQSHHLGPHLTPPTLVTSDARNRLAPPVSPRPYPFLGMDSDRIRTDTNSDVTIYHILFRIRIRLRILSNTDTKWIFQIRIHIRILTRFTA
jgi:hypothetical protein